MGRAPPFKKFAFFKRLRVYHASQINVKDIFIKQYKSTNPFLSPLSTKE